MCCHVSNKTAYAEEVQVRAERMKPQNDAKKGNDDDKESPTPGVVKGVEKKRRSPSYSHSPAESEDEVKMLEESPKKPVEDTPEKSLTNAVTNTVQPVKKKDGSLSQSPSPPKSQKRDKILKQPDKVIVVDSSKKSPKEDIENTVHYDWYKLHEDKDKDRFIDMVNRHASSLTLT